MASVVSSGYMAPPPGLNYLSSIEACYTFVLISLPLSSVLVPILLLILFFSTASSRKTLLFALNILIVLLGIAEGVLSTVVQSTIILHPRHAVSDLLFLTYIGVALYTPILVDCVLILRLSAVYPANITPRVTRLAILVVPFLCTAARIGCVTVFVRRWDLLGREISALMAGNIIWTRNPLVIADWSIQLFENLYCSSLFLCRLREHKAFSSRMYHHQSIAARLRAVFYIAVSNFVFPSILSIFQIIYIVHDPSVVHGATILMVNNYVSIIGVVFSTIWCSSDVWKGTHNAGPSFAFGLNGHDSAGATFPQSIITLTGIAPNLNLSPTTSRGPQPFSHAPSHSISRGHRPHPFATTYAGADRDRKDSNVDAGGVNIARNDANEFLQNLTLPRAKLLADVDADESTSCPSPSPITPHDVRSDVAGTGPDMKKDGHRWDASVAPLPSFPCPRERHHRSSPFEMRRRSENDESRPRLGPNASSSSDSDMDIELDFATPTPPPSDRHWYRQRRRSRSLSLSDSPDDRHRDPLSHARGRDTLSRAWDRDMGDIRLSPAFTEDGPDPHLRAFWEDERRLRASVEDDRHFHQFLEDDRPPHPRPFVDDDRPTPSPSRAHRPSFMDWSDAEQGGRTPASWDTHSLDEP